MRISEALSEVVTRLEAAGVEASADAGKLVFPGAFVVPGMITYPYLDKSTFDFQIDIYLLTVDNGAIDAIDKLQDLLEKVQTVFDVPEAEPISLPVGQIAGVPLPGLLISLQTTITKD